ncbi:MAG TPA: ArgE/DapE family deacylase, partial [Anaerolineae bacterium]|nr:ArgE/DapE family deacylase [Anaerolineae bacterium]
ACVLMNLIRFPSVCGEEMGAVNCMKEVLLSAGFNPSIIPMNPEIKSHPEYTQYTIEPEWEGRGNLITVYGGNGKGKSLILNAHIDVIPAKSWPDAFEPKRNDDIIIGRGACDDKGGVVAGYIAMRALAECGITTAGSLNLHIVIDEETGGNGTLSLLYNGHNADAAIVAECTDNVICPANRGALWFQLTTTGISTHMGEIDKGISAIEKATRAIDILKDYEHYLIENFMDHHYFQGLEHRPIQLCIGMIKAGEWPSMVPDHCEVEGGIGFLPNKDIDEVKYEMRQWIKEKGDTWLCEHFNLRYDKLHNAAFEVASNHPFVTCMRAVAPEAGISSHIQGWPVSCDARLFPRVADMPVITIGPGKLEHAHSRNEQVKLSEIVKTAKLYAFTAIEWCGVEGM